MKHLGSLESIHEARVALDYASSIFLTHLYVLSKLPRASFLDERTLTYESIVKLLLVCLFVFFSEPSTNVL